MSICPAQIHLISKEDILGHLFFFIIVKMSLCSGRQWRAVGVRGEQRPLDVVRPDVMGQRVLQQSPWTWSLQQRDALHPLDPTTDIHPHVPERLTHKHTHTHPERALVCSGRK